MGLFGTDGVRGLAGLAPLDAPTVGAIGMAFGEYYANTPGEFYVGMDPRESSPYLATAFRVGATLAGTSVRVVGVLPTPGLAYLTGSDPMAKGGVMFTASHNPSPDNGIKLFDENGDKVSDQVQDYVEARVQEFGGLDIEWRAEDLGNDPTLLQRYEDFLVAEAEGLDLSGRRIGVDTANGAASGFAERVFGKRLGGTVYAIGNKPNGRNINEQCGATHMDALRRLVVENELDLGIAFDGDADRFQAVTAEGELFDGDDVIYALATLGNQFFGENHKEVASTVMANPGTERALNEKGIKLVRTGVGDRNLLEYMRSNPDCRLGAEQSGHVIVSPHRTGDGMLTAIHTLRVAQASGKTLEQLRREIRRVPQRILSIPVVNGDKILLDHPDVAAYIQTRISAVDGIAFVRPSGTEELVRVTVFSDNADGDAEDIALGLSEHIAAAKHR